MSQLSSLFVVLGPAAAPPTPKLIPRGILLQKAARATIKMLLRNEAAPARSTRRRGVEAGLLRLRRRVRGGGVRDSAVEEDVYRSVLQAERVPGAVRRFVHDD